MRICGSYEHPPIIAVPANKGVAERNKIYFRRGRDDHFALGPTAPCRIVVRCYTDSRDAEIRCRDCGIESMCRAPTLDNASRPDSVIALAWRDSNWLFP